MVTVSSCDLFSDTSIAFRSKSDKELRRAYWLFKVMGNNFLTSLGASLTHLSVRAGLPVKGLIKRTIFHQFCGGESIEACRPVIEQLAHYHVGTILDYSVEGDLSEKSFDNACRQIVATIRLAEGNPKIPFTVFKPTGLGSFDLYAKVATKSSLSSDEKTSYTRTLHRISTVCREAADRNVRVLIDAEHSWIQPEIDKIAMKLMEEYNKVRAIIFNTYQLYRNDKLASLMTDITTARKKRFIAGVKLVRGAYMELERARAQRFGYPSPINSSKETTDHEFNKAALICLDNIACVEFIAGTHNEESVALLVDEMHKRRHAPAHPNIYFAQLFGMSDHITFNLAAKGYQVAKYLPFGSVDEVLPYLFRRARENTSVAGQAGRELKLLASEIRKRKKLK